MKECDSFFFSVLIFLWKIREMAIKLFVQTVQQKVAQSHMVLGKLLVS
jgi:hypothetical protein